MNVHRCLTGRDGVWQKIPRGIDAAPFPRQGGPDALREMARMMPLSLSSMGPGGQTIMHDIVTDVSLLQDCLKMASEAGIKPNISLGTQVRTSTLAACHSFVYGESSIKNFQTLNPRIFFVVHRIYPAAHVVPYTLYGTGTGRYTG